MTIIELGIYVWLKSNETVLALPWLTEPQHNTNTNWTVAQHQYYLKTNTTLIQAEE